MCTRLLARCGQGEQGAWTNTAVWAACLAPGAEEVRDSCVRLAEKMVAAAPRSHSHVNTLGAALYRAGRHAAAAARLEEAVYLHGREGTGWDWYFLAMTYQRLGRGAEARQALEKARTWAEHAVQGTLDDPLTPLPLSWSQRLELQRLRREAEAVLGSVVVPVW